MFFSKSGKAAAVLLAGLLAGCSASNINTHSIAVSDSDSIIHQETRNHREKGVNAYRSTSPLNVSLRGDKSKAFLASGQQHFKRQNYGLAEENFRKAVEVRSDSAAAWLGLAASLDQLGKFKTADKAYEQVTQLKGNNAKVLNNLGYSFLLRGDYQKARQLLNRAQNIDPTLEEIQGNIHLLEKTING